MQKYQVVYRYILEIEIDDNSITDCKSFKFKSRLASKTGSDGSVNI